MLSSLREWHLPAQTRMIYRKIHRKHFIRWKVFLLKEVSHVVTNEQNRLQFITQTYNRSILVKAAHIFLKNKMALLCDHAA